MRLQRWYDPPTMAGYRGACCALLVLLWYVAPALTRAHANTNRDANNRQQEHRMIHVVFYGSRGSGRPLSHCLAEFRAHASNGTPEFQSYWLENEECENPLHPLNEWQPCDFTMWGYLQTEHQLFSTQIWCYRGPDESPLSIRLTVQESA